MKLLGSHKDLLDYEKIISKELDICDLVSDIILSDEEEENIIFYMRDFIVNGSYKRVKFSLLVLVVNLAYKYYDEDGFWKHFYDVFNIKDDSVNAMDIGEVLEEALKEKKLIKYKREGTFRYVGVILEQVGVARKHIKNFAEVIQKVLGNESYYIEMQTSFEKYKAIIDTFYCHRYLKDFLKDESGWEYTLHITKILNFLENGLLNYNEIINLKGFGIDFWKEFFKYYNLPQNLSNQTSDNNTPILGFDAVSLQIYLKLYNKSFEFPVNMKQKVYIEKPNGERIMYFNETKDFKSLYIGEINNYRFGGKWIVHGWDYKNTPVVYFHEKYGYIPDNQFMVSGKYYLLSKKKELLDESSIIDTLGKIQIEYETFYIYKVLVKEISTQNLQINIDWKRDPDLQVLDSEYDIFFDELPELGIENKELLLNRDYILLYDLGDGPKRIWDFNTFLELKTEVKNKKSYCGKLWAHPLKRSKSDARNYEEIVYKFCVIPKTNILLPDKIYAIDKKIKISINNNPYIKFTNLEKSLENPIDRVIPAYEKILKGKIITENKEIDFTYRIDRLEINIKNEDDSTYIDPNNIKDRDYIEIKGQPNEICNLYISKDKQLYILSENTRLDENGSYTVQTRRMSHLFQFIGTDIGRLSVRMGTHIYTFNKGVIAYSKLLDDFNFINKLYDDIDDIAEIDKYAEEQVRLLYSFVSEIPVNTYPTSVNKNKVFKEIINIIKVLDYDEIVNLTLPFESLDKIDTKINSIRKTLKWVIDARIILEKADYENRQALLEEYKTLTWIPSFSRWKKQIEETYEALSQKADLPEWLIEWTEDVINGDIGTYKSGIIKTREGKLLTEAWKKYQQGRLYDVIDQLNKVINIDDGIIKDLKTILTCTLFLKNVRVSSLSELLINYHPSEDLESVVEIFNNYQKLINYNQISNYNKSPDSLLKNLPLLTEDANMLINLKKFLVMLLISQI